jgi:hypothetical protein
MMAVPMIMIISNNVNGKTFAVQNYSSSIHGTEVLIRHRSGATEGNDYNYDAIYNPFDPNPLHIYSHNYYSGLDYGIDARPLESTTTYNLHLKNIDFSGIADNSLRFFDATALNFNWKNIFLGDFNDSNDIVADIKYVINNGSIDNYGRYYGDFPLPKVDGSKIGVYDKRKVFFFNYSDFNRDRRVDFGDLEIFAQNWARTRIVKGNNPNDANDYADIANIYDENGNLVSYGDGKVDFVDFAIFSGEWLYNADDPNTWSRVR